MSSAYVSAKQNHTEWAALTHRIPYTDRTGRATIYLYPRACVTIQSSDNSDKRFREVKVLQTAS
jgi:hypothetical protein